MEDLVAECLEKDTTIHSDGTDIQQSQVRCPGVSLISHEGLLDCNFARLLVRSFDQIVIDLLCTVDCRIIHKTDDFDSLVFLVVRDVESRCVMLEDKREE